MNIDISQDLIKKISRYLILISIPFLVVKLLYVISLGFLEKNGVSLEVVSNSQFYERFRLSKSFDLKYYTPPKVETPKVVGTIYKLDNIKLRGTYISEERKFITIDDKNTIEFVDFESEYKGYKLIVVEHNRAVFIKDGKNYELTLDDGKLPEYKEIVTTQEEDILIKDDSLISIKRDIVQDYAKNFDSIWKDINIMEVRDVGEIIGFKIRYIKPESLFAKIGLLPGDLIQAVNNKELKSYADAFYFYKNLRQLSSIKITLLRDKEIKDLEYEIN